MRRLFALRFKMLCHLRPISTKRSQSIPYTMLRALIDRAFEPTLLDSYE
jgi:hypothetical protein